MSVLLNGKMIGNRCYPNNERIFDKKDTGIGKFNIITLNYETDIDITILSIIVRFLRDEYPQSFNRLIMRYIPYERMDRKIGGYIFSLKYFCQMINELHFDEVYVMNAHSSVSTALLDRVKEMDISQHIHDVITQQSIDCLFYPDNGAQKRYSELFTENKGSYINRKISELPHFFGDKKRDLDTGHILYYNLIEAPDLTDKNVLIVDDLCSMGYTFLMAAKSLKEAGAKTVSLYVSHCENSVFKGELLTTDYVNRIFTTYSLSPSSHEKITLMDWGNLNGNFYDIQERY